ncbi:MAG: response regulator transcription factor [Acidobacteria bacterium]|nr:response regulator transcription factor [Acidobacteriota bacterium]
MRRENPIRLLLVEDHVLLRESLVRTLAVEPDITVVGQCGSVTDALEAVSKDRIDIVLLDLNLGTEQGGAFLNGCREAGFQGAVLVVTAGVGEREAAWLMKRECKGIFLKHNPLRELIEHIRAIADGNPVRDEFATRAAVVAKDFGENLGRRALTNREREVLRGVCEGLLTKEIATRLQVTESSVKSYLQQLFLKTGVRTRAQLVRAAIEHYWDDLGAD